GSRPLPSPSSRGARSPWLSTARLQVGTLRVTVGALPVRSRDSSASLMPPPVYHLPAPPALPAYTVEEAVEVVPQPRRHRDPLDRHVGTGLARHDVVLDDDRID